MQSLTVAVPATAFADAPDLLSTSAAEIFLKASKTASQIKAPISSMEAFTLEKALESHPLMGADREKKEKVSQEVAQTSTISATKKVAYVDAGKISPVENETQDATTTADESVVNESPSQNKSSSKKSDKQKKSSAETEAGDELKQTLEVAAIEKEDQQIKKENRRQAYFRSEQGKRDQLVEAALSRQGVPYVYGGTDPDSGMDCSGFTQWCYSQIGISIGRTSYAQEDGAIATVDVSDAKPGDILCAGGHVAIYLGNGQMIHEPQSGDVCRVSDDLSQFHCAARYL